MAYPCNVSKIYAGDSMMGSETGLFPRLFSALTFASPFLVFLVI